MSHVQQAAVQSTGQQRSGLRLDRVNVSFGDYHAVRDADIEIRPGEFFTLLGPSGCGKTTLLRTIAGFNGQSSGSIKIGDVVVDNLPAHQRDTGMVFQNYAIFPHLSVKDNVAFGLKERGVRGSELEQRVAEALRMVDLGGYETRMPRQLSGGQQQRVVIARAVVMRPRVLLMDEPLANLDAKLRVRLRRDLKQLQRTLGLTTIYVTHDQEEALSLSDRIAVMSAGRVLQIGTPADIYERPQGLAVAEFIGEGTFLRGIAEGREKIKLENGMSLSVEAAAGDLAGNVWVGFRPQDVSVAPDEAARNRFTGTIRNMIYLGSQVRLEVDCGLARVVSAQIDSRSLSPGHVEGGTVTLSVLPERLMVFSGTEEEKEL